jgi:hypothetical protein
LSGFNPWQTVSEPGRNHASRLLLGQQRFQPVRDQPRRADAALLCSASARLS